MYRFLHYVMAHFLVKLITLSILGLPVIALAVESTQEVIQDTADQVLNALEEDQELRSDAPRLRQLVLDTIAPVVDYPTMSRLVLGKHWRRADDAQRERFTEQFRSLLVRTYTNTLSKYEDGQTINILGTQGGGQKKMVTVQTELTQPEGEPIAVDYRLRIRDDKWKVIDITIEGVSLVINYRNEFSNELSTGNIDSLIERLVDINESGEILEVQVEQ